MSQYVIKMPDVGEGVAEAEIVEWHVGVGDPVHEDDVIADVMTDKATVELPSPVDGVIQWLGAEIGDTVAVGTDLVRIDTGDGAAATDGDEEADTAGAAEAAEPAEPAEPVAPAEPGPDMADRTTDHDAPGPAATARTPISRPAETSTPHRVPGRAAAAPAVRERARRLGLDLTEIPGTGPEGRIVHADLDALLTRHAAPARRPGRGEPEEIERVKVIGLRRNIAERMQASKRRIPHFTYVEQLDVTDLEGLREELNATRLPDQPKLSLLPFLMRAVVRTVGHHPQMNARFDDEAGVVERHRAVHLGIAVQTRRGLMVPVVKDADRLDIWSCAEEVARLSEAARAGTITLDELSGSTITITSLGALGGIVTTPVINAPEVAIVGVNKITTSPVYVDGALLPRQIMNLSSSFDHRIIDGVDAAEFIQDVKRLIETPALLFLPDE